MVESQKLGQRQHLSIDKVNLQKPLLAQVVRMHPDDYHKFIEMPRMHTAETRIFEKDWMDACTMAPWWHPIGIWGPILWGYAALSFDTRYIAAGLLLWTFVEYHVHRFVFHLRPRTADQIHFHFLAHGYHHLHPMDVNRIMLPTPIHLTIGLCMTFLAVWLAGVDPGLSIMIGFGCGYVSYDHFHYALHFIKSRSFATLRKRHMNHHYLDDRFDFGISPPARLWDHLYNTSSTVVVDSGAACAGAAEHGFMKPGARSEVPTDHESDSEADEESEIMRRCFMSKRRDAEPLSDDSDESGHSSMVSR
eukprot:ANDGO_01244.mRNA.1 Dihydroceramide fatty acyl 2-hydroxylase FAH1